MCESFAFSLREAIYDQMAGSDGCYLVIYSGLGEKLSFLSSLLRKSLDDLSVRIMVNVDLRQYNGMFNSEGYTLIDGSHGKRKEESAESYCLRTIRERLYKFGESRVETSRILVVVDCSAFLVDPIKPLADGVLSFHRDVADLLRSMKGVTGILLYNTALINEEIMYKLLEIHGALHNLSKSLSPKIMKEELEKMVKSSESFPEVKAFDEGLLLLDPALNSVVLLAPVTDTLRTILPRDPLDVTHRDIAFSNNYTAYKEACPYFSEDAPSQCLLDPNIIRTVKTRGRSFIHGQPCITATDHMVLEKSEGCEQRKEAPSNEEDRCVELIDNAYRIQGRLKRDT